MIKHGSTTISTGSDTTDSNGEISVTYAATGVGDITVEFDFEALQETYTIEDCFRYIENGSVTYSSGTQTFTKLAELPSDVDFEASVYLQSSNVKGMNLAVKRDNSSANSYIIRVGTGADGSQVLQQVTSSQQDYYTFSTSQFPSTSTLVKIRVQGNTVYFENNGKSVTRTNYLDSSFLKYIGVLSFYTAKTINYSKFKVKAL